MGLPQQSCPICDDSIQPPRQSHYISAQDPASFHILEDGQQLDSQASANNRSTGIRLAQTDRQASIRGQQQRSRARSVSDHTLRGRPSVNHEEGIMNAKHDQRERKHVAHKRSAFRNHIANFQWQWFACTMSTGGIGILLSEQPHTFRGLETIGKLFFITTIALFVIFTCAISLRFIFDRKALYRSLVDPIESFFFGCFWLSQATIIGNIARYGVPAAGPWLIKALEVLIWYYVGAALLVGIFLFTTHFSHHDLGVDRVQPSWVLMIYPTMLAGTLASLTAPQQPTSSALPIIIGGIAFQGLGFMVSFMIITIFLWRCFYAGLPDPQVRVGMFIIIGAPGYTATALQGLAQAAVSKFPPGYMQVNTVPAGDILLVISIAIGAWLWLLSFMFFAWSAACVSFGVKKMTFDVTWWASIFPNVGWVVSTSLLGQALQSQGIQWVASGMTIMLVVFWLFVAVSHVKAILTGKCPPAS